MPASRNWKPDVSSKTQHEIRPGGTTYVHLRQSGTRCRAYVLEGEAPPAVPLHHSRGGTYFKVWAASPAEAELEIEQAYQRRPELEQ